MAPERRLHRRMVKVAVGALALAACSGSGATSAPSSPRTTASESTTTTAAESTTAPASTTVWLCRPGATDDPCEANTASTSVSPTNTVSVVPGEPPSTQLKPVDCFYVYPTVSTQAGPNADLTIEPAEKTVAEAQASRFSSVCNVWAPMYRQVTLSSLGSGVGPALIAFQSLHAAWEDYLHHDNEGRPIVFLGHSQGAAILINLLQQDVDESPELRAELVSAVILGGNVEVPIGKDVGSTFQHIPACRSTSQTGCVIAYSSFPTQPPADALFGIPGQGVSLQSGQTERTGVAVLCTNPGDLADSSASAPLLPLFWIAGRPSRALVTTDWVGFPALYTGRCREEGSASWLQIDDIGTTSDSRPRLQLTSGPQWGYHVADFNVALGNLVDDVRAQITAYLAAHPA